MKRFLAVVSAVCCSAGIAIGGNLLMPDGKIIAGLKSNQKVKVEQLDGRLNVTAEGGWASSSVSVPVAPENKLMRLRMNLRATDVKPGNESWKDGRLAMRFFNGKKAVGAWPQVFNVTGTTNWIRCDRYYDVPEGAKELRLDFANFGVSGKVEFFDVRLEPLNDASEMDIDAERPDGLASEKTLWDLKDAWRQKTPSRESISLNGMWKFRPVLKDEALGVIPKAGSGWGYFKVPGIWPRVSGDDQEFILSPLMAAKFKSSALVSAWYKRTIQVPADWKERNISLYFDLLQSCAKIFVDGKEAGDLYYPGGSIDLTGKLVPGREHELTLLVSALPVASSVYMAADRVFTGDVKPLRNRGIAGDVYLNGIPENAAVGDVHVITSFRKKSITFDTGFDRLPAGKYRMEAEIWDGEKSLVRFRSPLFSTEGKPDFRYQWSEKWIAPKLWDTDTPENMYCAKLRLTDANGKTLDEYLPQDFGFREFWVEGRDFYLNGKRIHLRAFVAGHVRDTGRSSDEVIAYLDRAAKEFGLNFFLGWNYDFAPGTFQYYRPFHTETSKRGLLTSITLPHAKDFKNQLEKPEVADHYRRINEHIVRQYQNVPGVIMYVMNHNATGYYGDQNPRKIAENFQPEKAVAPQSLPRRYQAKLAEDIARKIDSSRPLYHHSSGSFGDVYTLNCYLNWAPRQERSDWLELWEKQGSKPIFTVEWGMPHVASWSSWRGPEFIWRNAALQCVWVDEYNAAILGEEAYRSEKAKEEFARHQEKLGKGNKETLFSQLGGNNRLNRIEDVHKVRNYFVSRNFRDMRARGISGMLPWDQFTAHDRVGSMPNQPNPDRFKNLKQPGLVLDNLRDSGEWIVNPRARFKLTTTGEAMQPDFQEQIGFIGGRKGDFTEAGHNFMPGETISKSLVILNDTRRDRKVPWQWSVPELGVSGKGETTVQPGGRVDIPIEFKLPAGFAGEKLNLVAQFDFSSGVRKESLSIDVVKLPAVKLTSKIGVYDPTETAAPLLKKLGVSFKVVKSDADLDGVTLLVVGRNALEGFPLHLSEKLRNGLRLLVLEQSVPVLSRLGLRSNEYALREVFPLVSEFYSTPLRDWRGASTLLSPYLTNCEGMEFSNPRWDWQGFSNTRVWRAGNRGSVTSVLLEKPVIGNWLPLLQGGFDLQYTPVVELQEGKGRILFSQLDLSARSEMDPEGILLLGKMLRRLDENPNTVTRPVYYCGGEVGRKLLQSLAISFKELKNDNLSDDALLVVAPGAKLPENLKSKIEAGLRVLTLGLDRNALEKLGASTLPATGKFYSDYANGLSEEPAFLGVSNADLHWRAETVFDAFPVDSVGGRALQKESIGKGTLVMLQLAPWSFDNKEFYLRTTIRRNTALVSRLLANLGAASHSGFGKLLDGVKGNVKFALPNEKWQGIADPTDKGRAAGYFKPEFKIGKEWRPVKVPGCFDVQFKDLAGYDGLFWYRLEFDAPVGLAADDVFDLTFGAIDDESWIWLNGKFLGEVTQKSHPSNYWSVNRSYPIKGSHFKSGRNVLVVLVNDTFNNGGILGTPAVRGEERYGFYPDKPIFSDDPYRYYRW